MNCNVIEHLNDDDDDVISARQRYTYTGKGLAQCCTGRGKCHTHKSAKRDLLKHDTRLVHALSCSF